MRYARAARRAREQHGEKKIDAGRREREERRDVVLLKIASAQRERERDVFFFLSPFLFSFSNISRKIARLSSVNIDDKTSKDRATRAFILIQQLLYFR